MLRPSSPKSSAPLRVPGQEIEPVNGYSQQCGTAVAAHLKAHCCPKAPFRRVPRSLYEEARDVARALAKTEAFERSRHERKRVEMLFAHLKRILRLDRLRLRGPCGAHGRAPPLTSMIKLAA
jgi:hypothetical protein